MTSAHGGLLFLVHLVTKLDLVPRCTAEGSPLAGRAASWTLTALAGSMTGAPADDAAVRAFTGADPQEVTAPPVREAEQAELDAIVAQLVEELRTRLRARDDDDLRWVWRRTAVIRSQPGWTEATLRLDDVDTRIRMAGLDLDPGFVWWLGAVLRFRYA